MSNEGAEDESEVDRRYICDSCETIVRARYRGTGSFCVGCDCTTVLVVPQMGQAETPERWRVEREECCRGVEVSTMETAYGELGADYRCTECGAMYSWDGQMQTPPQGPDTDPGENERLVTDGGVDQSEAGADRLPYECQDCGKVLEDKGDVLVHAIAVTGDDDHEGGFEF